MSQQDEGDYQQQPQIDNEEDQDQQQIDEDNVDGGQYVDENGQPQPIGGAGASGELVKLELLDQYQ